MQRVGRAGPAKIACSSCHTDQTAFCGKCRRLTERRLHRTHRSVRALRENLRGDRDLHPSALLRERVRRTTPFVLRSSIRAADRSHIGRDRKCNESSRDNPFLIRGRNRGSSRMFIVMRICRGEQVRMATFSESHAAKLHALKVCAM
jgi:hypothetical protein